MPSVKICGITNLEDALFAASCGADALGFVFYENSPRFITPEETARIISQLPPFVTTVGLFVNETADRINQTMRLCRLDRAQLHFEIDEAFLGKIAFPALPVIRARKPEDLERFASRYRIVDSYCECYGGSGKRLNLEWFADRDNSKTILAGGLDPDNLPQVLSHGFYGVDVSSGVEAYKGKKDLQRVQKFIDNAKNR